MNLIIWCKEAFKFRITKRSLIPKSWIYKFVFLCKFVKLIASNSLKLCWFTFSLNFVTFVPECRRRISSFKLFTFRVLRITKQYQPTRKTYVITQRNDKETSKTFLETCWMYLIRKFHYATFKRRWMTQQKRFRNKVQQKLSQKLW